MSSSLKRPHPIRYLRWWIALLLFGMTVINYIDRQTLSALSPHLKDQYNWSNTDYAWITNAFRVSYTVMQAVFGHVLDRVGTHAGLTMSVLFYSCIGILTATAQGFWSFCGLRFLLGAGEAANNPGSSKAVSEWFPAKERAFAVALFNSGSSIGGALAPLLALGIYEATGSWRPAFLVAGCLGFAWWLVWRKLYRLPEDHTHLTPDELKHIQAGRASNPKEIQRIPWSAVLRYRQAWGIILGRFFLDPFWFFLAEWYALYLQSKNFDMKASALGFWGPFAGACLGNFVGGAFSSYLIRRGWSIGRARRTALLVAAPGMACIAAANYANNYWILLSIGAFVGFAYTFAGTTVLTLPSDVFHTRAVGTITGISGAAAGISTLITTILIGYATDRTGSFDVILLGAAILPLLATMCFVILVRRAHARDPQGILLDF